MKRQLVAFATATAMAAPMAVLADAHEDGPEVYGRVHLSFDYENYDGDDGGDGDLAATSRSSRLGVRGEESLNGLDAFYQFETQIDWGFPDGVTDSRDSFVGVRGDWGQVRAGRLPALNTIVYGPGNFFPTQAGDPGNVLGALGSQGGELGGRTGQPAIEYSTALTGPFQAAVAIVPSAAGDAEEGYEHDVSLVLSYADGPLSAQFTAINYNFEEDGGAGLQDDQVYDDTIFALSGQYDLDMMRFGGGLASVSADEDDRDDSALWLGGAFDLTATGTINAQYSMLIADDSDNDASIIAVGYTEALSDRTSGYVNLAFVSNDEDSSVVPHGYAGHGNGPKTDIDTDEDGQVVSVGVIHDF